MLGEAHSQAWQVFVGNGVVKPEQSKLQVVQFFSSPTDLEASADIPGPDWLLPSIYQGLCNYHCTPH